MDKIIAAFSFFTRLPVWKITSPPQSAYSDVVMFWPMVGWFTGGITALTMFGLSYVIPWPVAVIVAIALRLLITGALHEDGLADFFDGFGGGSDKNRILSIMKDSHIGTYGVVALIVYFIIMVSVLVSLTPTVAAIGFFASDSFSKLCAAWVTNRLPYARPEGAKNCISYAKMRGSRWLLCWVFGIVPLFISFSIIGWRVLPPCMMSVLMAYYLYSLMDRKIGGYTGDCCGAVFLICEMMFMVGLSVKLFF